MYLLYHYLEYYEIIFLPPRIGFSESGDVKVADVIGKDDKRMIWKNKIVLQYSILMFYRYMMELIIQNDHIVRVIYTHNVQ